MAKGPAPGSAAGQRVEGRRLVGVLAVAQRLGASQAQAEPLREAVLRLPAARQGRGDGGVVGRREPEGLEGQGAARVVGERAALVQLGEDSRVVVRVADDAHRGVVLGRRAHQGGAADVDLLDELVVLRRPAGPRPPRSGRG